MCVYTYTIYTYMCIYIVCIYTFVVHTEYLYMDTMHFFIDLDSPLISGATDIWFKTALMVSRCVISCVFLLCPVSDHQNFPVLQVGVFGNSILRSRENKKY